MNQTLTLINMAILFANLIVLGLTMKLYTEHFKDRVQEKRRG